MAHVTKKIDGQYLTVSADFAQASSPLWGCWHETKAVPPASDEKWFQSPYQVADARHRRDQAIELLKNYDG